VWNAQESGNFSKKKKLLFFSDLSIKCLRVNVVNLCRKKKAISSTPDSYLVKESLVFKKVRKCFSSCKCWKSSLSSLWIKVANSILQRSAAKRYSDNSTLHFSLPQNGSTLWEKLSLLIQVVRYLSGFWGVVIAIYSYCSDNTWPLSRYEYNKINII
jgi:hypothetical protein